jgi:hypothetical protein
MKSHLDHIHTLRVPRSRGAVSGLLLIILGLWGALIPFIGPYFTYSYQTDQTWVWSAARFWLEVLPGAVAVIGGILLLIAANRIAGSLGGWLAAAAGTWFVIGQSLSAVLRIGSVGEPLSTGDGGRAVEQLGYFYGLGALILFLAAFALGRLAVVGVRDVRAAERHQEQEQTAVPVQQRATDVSAPRHGTDSPTVPAPTATTPRPAIPQRETDARRSNDVSGEGIER